jgi:antitoxin ParD1/3/4
VNVSLTPELENLVHEKVASGLYLSASEVVREALRLLQERDQLRELQRAELRKQVAEGLQQLDHGEAVAGHQVFEEIKEKSRKKRQQA